VEVVDGCADISVVTIGTLIAFGVDDETVLEEVDASNLRKFEPGSYRREDGKWIKPPSWTPPDIEGAIERGNAA
jgi:predicted HAD superfamily Cof-like phosphohydrolase